MNNHANIVSALRQSVAGIDGTRQRIADRPGSPRLPFGIDEIDTLTGGGLALNELHEFRCPLSRDIGCMCGFLVGLMSGLEERGPVVWVSEPSALPDTGKLFPGGFDHFQFDAGRLVHVHPVHLNDCLWAAGEAARTGGLAAIVFHLKGNPKSFDLSVSRKLMLRAQRSGTPVFMLRQAGGEEASSAATRWRIEPAPSLPNEIYSKGLGHMRLALTLEKNRNGQTGHWIVAWNPQTRSFEHAASRPATTHTRLPLHASADRPHSAPAMGQVVAPRWDKRQAS